MADLTVIILTKDEEDNITTAVDSVKPFARRVVLVDSFSTDNTVGIAEDLGCSVYQNPWSNHAAQFNWGLDNCEIGTEWVLRLDADEVVTPELAAQIDRFLASLPHNVDGVFIRRRIHFMGRWIRYGGVYPNLVLRIFRSKKGRCEERIMDEHIVTEGDTVELGFDIIDDNKKSLTWWTNKHNWYSDKECFEVLNLEKLKSDGKLLKPRLFGSFAEKKRWLKENIYLRLPLGYRAWLYYAYRYYLKLGFLDGPEGKIFHFLQAYWYRFLVDAKLFEAKKMDMDLADRVNKALE